MLVNLIDLKLSSILFRINKRILFKELFIILYGIDFLKILFFNHNLLKYLKITHNISNSHQDNLLLIIFLIILFN